MNDGFNACSRCHLPGFRRKLAPTCGFPNARRTPPTSRFSAVQRCDSVEPPLVPEPDILEVRFMTPHLGNLHTPTLIPSIIHARSLQSNISPPLSSMQLERRLRSDRRRWNSYKNTPLSCTCYLRLAYQPKLSCSLLPLGPRVQGAWTRRLFISDRDAPFGQPTKTWWRARSRIPSRVGWELAPVFRGHR